MKGRIGEVRGVEVVGAAGVKGNGERESSGGRRGVVEGCGSNWWRNRVSEGSRRRSKR